MMIPFLMVNICSGFVGYFVGVGNLGAAGLALGALSVVFVIGDRI